MEYFYLFLASLVGSSLACFGLYFLQKLRKKETNLKNSLLIGGLNFLVSLLVNSLIFIFVVIFYFHASSLYEAGVYFSFALIISLLNPGGYILNSIKEKKLNPQGFLKGGIVFLFIVCFFVSESLLYNQVALKSKGSSTSISLEDSSYVVDKGNFLKDEEGTYTSNGNYTYLILTNLPSDASSITFNFKQENVQLTCTISTRNSLDENWKEVTSYSLNANYKEFATLSISGGSSYYRFVFSNDTSRPYNGSSLTISTIVINESIPFRISLIRLWAITGLLFLASKLPSLAKKAQHAPTKSKTYKITLTSLLLVSLVSLLIVALYSPRGPGYLLTSYPMDDNELYDADIFVQLFDALKKGQLSLDITPDYRLLELGDDVYNPYLRSQSGASFLWDHAFYNGKYYCYFGLIPVIFVSFPIYWLTGCVSNAIFLELFYFILVIFALGYLTVVLCDLFKIAPNPIIMIFVLIAIVFGGFYSNLVAYNDWNARYHLPFVAGLANILLFILFVALAYPKEKKGLYLAIAGFFFVATMGSRPDFGLWLLFVAPILLVMLFKKGETGKRKALNFVPMFAILIIGAVGLMYYNYARFGSLLEFGQSYQLTVGDMREAKFSASAFMGAIYHYFMQAPSISKQFNFINPAYTKQSFDFNSYQDGTIGLLCNPLFYAMLFFTLFDIAREEKISLKISYILMPVTLVILSWSIYSLGGTCFRYLLGLAPLMGFITLVTFLRFISLSDGYIKMMGYVLAFILFTGAFLFGALLIPNSFDGMQGEDLQGIIIYAIRELFGAYNFV